MKVHKGANVLLPSRTGFAMLVLLLPAIVGSNDLFPVMISEVQVSSSQQCEQGIPGMMNISAALNAVSQLLSETLSPTSLPKSCLEVKTSLQHGIPLSGYYTIMDAATGNVSVVFCDMEDVESCPAVEQAFAGLQDDYQSLLEEVVWTKSELNATATILQQMKDDLASVSKTVSDTLSSTNSILTLHISASSCEEVGILIPSGASGYYTITAANGTYQQVYCLFDSVCGSDGPWTRLAYLNMSDPTQQCPSELVLHEEGAVRTCGKTIPLPFGCNSVTFPSPVSYSEICGRVNGYQYGTPNGWITGSSSVDIPYVEGVSLTQGPSPRQHVWSFAAEVFDERDDTSHTCDCSAPSFVGSDFYCESGNHGNDSPIKLYLEDVLWDGEDCGSQETDCCLVGMAPWFHKVMSNKSSEYLEMRICGSTGKNENPNEDSPVSLYEIYVK